MHGHFEILYINYWQQKGWNINKYQGIGWGFSESFIIVIAKEKYLELQNDGIPFVLIVETIDTKVLMDIAQKIKFNFMILEMRFLRLIDKYLILSISFKKIKTHILL